MQEVLGPAFDHYIRTDRSGARPLPPVHLREWLECGWLEQVNLPNVAPLDPVPCTVLDPFSGAGTVALAAQKLGRRGIGIDLSTKYNALAVKRLEDVPLPM